MPKRTLHPNATVTPLTAALVRKRCGWWVATDGMSAMVSFGYTGVTIENAGTLGDPNYWLEMKDDYGRCHPTALERHNRSNRSSATAAVSAAERAMRTQTPAFLHPDYHEDNEPTLVTDYPQHSPRFKDAKGTLVVGAEHVYLTSV